jgi:hypothetical protein
MAIFYKTLIDQTSLGSWARTSTTGLQHVGEFTLRAGNRYLDIKLDYASQSAMLFFQYWGFLYNRANCYGYAGTYPYSGTSFINTYIYNSGSTTLASIYKTSAYYICLKFDSQSDGYSEGKINVLMSSHGLDLGYRVGVLAFAQNESSSAYYS